MPRPIARAGPAVRLREKSLSPEKSPHSAALCRAARRLATRPLRAALAGTSLAAFAARSNGTEAPHVDASLETNISVQHHGGSSHRRLPHLGARRVASHSIGEVRAGVAAGRLRGQERV